MAMMLPVIDVAVCIIQSPDGRVLIAERTARQLGAGFWEMPGGKIDPGETAAQAAIRELREEVGVTPTGVEPWLTYEHRFPTRRLRLHFHRARGWTGTPQGREGQRLVWVDPLAPHVGPILPSNDRALFALALPPAYLVADFSSQGSAEPGLRQLRAHLDTGVRLIRLRLAAGAPGQRAALLARAASLAAAYPGAIILAGSTMEASRAGLAGVHSCARSLRRLLERPPVRVWSATCHTAADLAAAVSLGADFVVIPASPNSRGAAGVQSEWEELRHAAAASPVAFYAEGPGTLAGAAGVVRIMGGSPIAMPAERRAASRQGADIFT